MTIRNLPSDGRRRAVVEAISPRVDDGRSPIKRVVGDVVTVEADAFADGHDVVTVRLRQRAPGARTWTEIPMDPLGNDRWRASFAVERLGRHEYTVAAWTDAWTTWRRDLRARIEAGQDLTVDLLIGADLVGAAAARATGADRKRLATAAAHLREAGPLADRARAALDDRLDGAMVRAADREHETVHEPPLEIVVDPVRARFSAWYELFPRSTAPVPGRHGTLLDVVERLPYVAGMGFDVLYLPPIHPVGRTFRKGPNNSTVSGPDDPGVPWAIGGPEGGHMAVHPELGTLDDLHTLVAAATDHGMSLALDIAFQASPDHPAVAEHPTWFRQRPDGTVQYAENPPKKYQDIYPFDFESEDWQGLWAHLRDVIRFWADQGVRIFRVDNPHTKAFPFWEWCIADLKRQDPDLLFLSEAFTRPKVMYRLAKIGFSQSYTYFTWRTTKSDLADYFTELSRPPISDFFRPNAWPNTPDILHEVLQRGGRPAFALRVVLAATLSANYGIYGPAYELGDHEALKPGTEDYRDSEKYQIREWDLEREDSLAPLIGRLNRARRDHPALQANDGLAIHTIDHDQLLAYSKHSVGGDDVVLTVVTLDPHRPVRGTLHLPLAELGLPADRPFEVEDLLDGTVEVWQGAEQPIELDPTERVARVLHLRARARTELEFEDYQP